MDLRAIDDVDLQYDLTVYSDLLKIQWYGYVKRIGIVHHIDNIPIDRKNPRWLNADDLPIVTNPEQKRSSESVRKSAKRFEGVSIRLLAATFKFNGLILPLGNKSKKFFLIHDTPLMRLPYGAIMARFWRDWRDFGAIGAIVARLATIGFDNLPKCDQNFPH